MKASSAITDGMATTSMNAVSYLAELENVGPARLRCRLPSPKGFPARLPGETERLDNLHGHYRVDT